MVLHKNMKLGFKYCLYMISNGGKTVHNLIPNTTSAFVLFKIPYTSHHLDQLNLTTNE